METVNSHIQADQWTPRLRNTKRPTRHTIMELRTHENKSWNEEKS